MIPLLGLYVWSQGWPNLDFYYKVKKITIFMIFIFCIVKGTLPAFGVKIKFCRNLINFQFHQDAVNTEVYRVFMQFSQKI